MWTVIGGFLCDCIRFIGVFSDGQVLYWRSLQLIWPRPYKTTHSDHEYSYYSLMKLHYSMNTPRLDALISAIIAMCQRQNPVKEHLLHSVCRMYSFLLKFIFGLSII